MAQLFSPCQRRANGVNRVQNIFTIDVFVCGEEQRRRQGDVTRGRLGSALFAAEFSVDLPGVDAPYYWIRSNSQPAGWTLQLRAEWARKAGRAGVALLSLSCSLEIGTFFLLFLHVNTQDQSGGGKLCSADKVLPRVNLKPLHLLTLVPLLHSISAIGSLFSLLGPLFTLRWYGVLRGRLHVGHGSQF